MDKRGEQLRENMYEAIDQYERGSKEVVQASQVLDEYMNEHCSYKNNLILGRSINMKTGYTVNESGHTSLLEDGFMPVETALEVPVQEQLLKPGEISINAADFEKLIALIGVIIKPMDFTKKFKIELNYDPENPRVKMKCLKFEKEIIKEVNNNKKTAGIENQVQLEKLYESKLENGIKLNVSISAKIESLDQEIFIDDIEKNIHEILQSFSISTRNFYLLFGNEIKNKLL